MTDTDDTNCAKVVVVRGMGRRIRLEPPLAVEELARRYSTAYEPYERGWAPATAASLLSRSSIDFTPKLAYTRGIR